MLLILAGGKLRVKRRSVIIVAKMSMAIVKITHFALTVEEITHPFPRNVIGM